MSIDERIFGFLYRALRPKARQRVDPASTALADCNAELRLLACAIAERDVVLREAQDEGAIHGTLLLLPERMGIAQNAGDNRRCYVARVAFDATVVQLGLALGKPAGSAAERMLATLLAAPTVLAQVQRELPAARVLFEELGALEQAARWHVRVRDPQSAALEQLVRQRLGAAADLPLTAAGQAWLERVAQLSRQPCTAVELCDALAALAPFVRDARVAPLWLWGGIDACPPAPPAARAVSPAERQERSQRADHTVRARPILRRVERRAQPQEENPLVHSFEKVHTADTYRGGNKRADGSDELQQHRDALDELEIAELTVCDQTASGMVRADFDLEGSAAEEQAAAADELFVYDEWDERAQRYRSAWCCVYAVPPALTVGATEAQTYVARALARQRQTVLELRSELLRVRNARELKHRQSDGPDVDIDALVDRYAALRSGHTGADKLYCARRQQHHDLAVFLLMDASLSSDAWVAGQRVLDVAKGALLVLGEALGAEDVPTAIASFSSQTRKRCSFSLLKGWDDSWLTAQQRVVSVEPSGYTRIGPALRHATQLLLKHPAPKRLLVLISDAKPTDYDRYEGRYGNSDVRKAVAEACAEHVSVFALAIDARASAQLPSMFERGRYQVLPRPEGLARALAELYADLLR